MSRPAVAASATSSCVAVTFSWSLPMPGRFATYPRRGLAAVLAVSTVESGLRNHPVARAAQVPTTSTCPCTRSAAPMRSTVVWWRGSAMMSNDRLVDAESPGESRVRQAAFAKDEGERGLGSGGGGDGEVTFSLPSHTRDGEVAAAESSGDGLPEDARGLGQRSGLADAGGQAFPQSRNETMSSPAESARSRAGKVNRILVSSWPHLMPAHRVARYANRYNCQVHASHDYADGAHRPHDLPLHRAVT